MELRQIDIELRQIELLNFVRTYYWTSSDRTTRNVDVCQFNSLCCDTQRATAFVDSLAFLSSFLADNNNIIMYNKIYLLPKKYNDKTVE